MYGPFLDMDLFFSDNFGPVGPILSENFGPGPKFSADQIFRDSSKLMTRKVAIALISLIRT